MKNLPKIALGAWAWGNDGTFDGDITAGALTAEETVELEKKFGILKNVKHLKE